MKKLAISFLVTLVLSTSAFAIGTYIDNGDGTVTDQATGLMWQQSDDGVERTWEEALEYSENLALAGYSDWRLPDIRELESIVDDTRYDPAIDTNYFLSAKSSYYWSGSSYACYSDLAWHVYFYYGRVSASSKTYRYYVRCVRSGPSGTFEPLPPLVISFSTDSGSGDAPFSPSFACSVSSGNPPYTYICDFGDGTPATTESGTDSVTYTAPHTYTSPGTYTAAVTVTDSAGQSDYKAIQVVVKSPVITPLSADQYNFFAAPGDVIPMRAYGGKGIFYWLVAESDTGGYFEQDGNSVSLFAGQNALYHLPATPGTYVVSLSDGSTSKKITIDSRSPVSLTLSPDTLMLSTQESAASILTVANYDDGTNGIPAAVTWSSEDVNIACVDESGNITPVANGTTRIAATFQGVTGYCTVTVDTTPISLLLDPYLLFLNLDETVAVDVIATWRDGSRSAIQGVTLTSDDPVVSIAGTSVTGLSNGTAIIRATHQGLTAEGIVQVIVPTPLGLDPPSLRLSGNESAVVSISGGVPPFSVDSGTVSGSAGRHWNITAPSEAGSYQFHVTDSAGASLVLNLTVFARFSITASKNSVTMGEQITVTPEGGKPPYLWQVTAGDISTMESQDG